MAFVDEELDSLRLCFVRFLESGAVVLRFEPVVERKTRLKKSSLVNYSDYFCFPCFYTY